jgi:hypothetical protein
MKGARASGAAAAGCARELYAVMVLMFNPNHQRSLLDRAAAAVAGGGDSSSGGVAADWETSAAVILPRDLRGLYTASISLVRLFSAEVQPVHVATAPQRDTRGMVTVSTAVETVITVAR